MDPSTLGTDPAAPAAPASQGGGDATEPSDTAAEAVTPAAGGEQPAGDQPATQGGTPPADGAPDPAAAAARREPNLTARMAALSRKNREATIALRQAEARAKTAEDQAKRFGQVIEQAKDASKLPDLLEKELGLSFEQIVDVYAKRGEPEVLTPEQQALKAVEDIRKELDGLKKAREDEAKTAAERAQAAQRSEMVGGIAKVVKDNAAKFEICARLGDEAAEAVFDEVTKAWDKAGRPQLMPGEYDAAVLAAIDFVELQYEDRGKKLAKAGKSPGAAATTATAASGEAAAAASPDGAKANPSKISRDLPADFFGAQALSDTDKAILDGLRDKTAPMVSAKPKPRTINSTLGGSAPPAQPARGSQDSRDALREVLAQHGLAR